MCRYFYWMVPDFDKPVGSLSYDLSTKQFSIEVFDVDRKILPISMKAIVDGGKNPLSGNLANEWVCSRVEPPDRINISDILECAGISTYDVFGLLLYHSGRAVYDKMYLIETTNLFGDDK